MSILIAIALTFFANLGLSIILAIQLAYKQISQLVNIVSLSVFLCCQLVVLAHPSWAAWFCSAIDSLVTISSALWLCL